MTHPKIPGHPRFMMNDGAAYFFPPNGMDAWLRVDNLIGPLREDCAAIAECAWWEKAEADFNAGESTDEAEATALDWKYWRKNNE